MESEIKKILNLDIPVAHLKYKETKRPMLYGQ